MNRLFNVSYLSELIVKRRIFSMLGCLVLLVVCVQGIPKLTFSPDMDNFFPEILFGMEAIQGFAWTSWWISCIPWCLIESINRCPCKKHSQVAVLHNQWISIMFFLVLGERCFGWMYMLNWAFTSGPPEEFRQVLFAFLRHRLILFWGEPNRSFWFLTILT